MFLVNKEKAKRAERIYEALTGRYVIPRTERVDITPFRVVDIKNKDSAVLEIYKMLGGLITEEGDRYIRPDTITVEEKKEEKKPVVKKKTAEKAIKKVKKSLKAKKK